MITTVAADGKEREMCCIPYKFVFGWLFSIDTSRVNEEARPIVLRYKAECYEALYRHFAEPQTFLAEKQKVMNEAKAELNSQTGHEATSTISFHIKVALPASAG